MSILLYTEECKVMGPLIDQELEQVDAKHNELMSLNQKLIDSFQLYTRLMKDATASQYSMGHQSAYLPQQQATAAYSMPHIPQQSGATAMYSTSNQLPDPSNQVRVQIATTTLTNILSRQTIKSLYHVYISRLFR